MQVQKIVIKGMVCERCISSVTDELLKLDVQVMEVSLGQVILQAPFLIDEALIGERLRPLGFTLLSDKRSKVVKDVKALISEMYSGHFDFADHFRFSAFLASRMNMSYDKISNDFYALEKTSLEQFSISFRIDKIKEELVYTNKSLADIAVAFGFSSVAHVSKQFKTHTGLNPSYFRKLKTSKEATQASLSKA
ncbi:AraC family transcriptional regulator [Flaviaesturariibacter flavus]|uniref:AraC family transcriptional regulator n=1 Tax=Flaviaesturariibacter flavus TaxID=2502780 RepID=A0A4R1B286_9BACT|nr:helix-turn-helix domain-containing protein [Flaviaesturariibacter flavus]TCJ12154.1 AraC family transcriptional regulator [Flaviaesturariibacter flavus]